MQTGRSRCSAGFLIFTDLPESVLAGLDAISNLMSVNPDAPIIDQGESPRALYFVRDGQVALSTTAPDGTSAGR